LAKSDSVVVAAEDTKKVSGLSAFWTGRGRAALVTASAVLGSTSRAQRRGGGGTHVTRPTQIDHLVRGKPGHNSITTTTGPNRTGQQQHTHATKTRRAVYCGHNNNNTPVHEDVKGREA
ncbi:unnamed protein product, partial [Ectocarpus sp. 6 AP-2014]